MTGAELTALLMPRTAMSFAPGPNATLSTAPAANLGLRHALVLVAPVGGMLAV